MKNQPRYWIAVCHWLLSNGTMRRPASMAVFDTHTGMCSYTADKDWKIAYFRKYWGNSKIHGKNIKARPVIPFDGEWEEAVGEVKLLEPL